jgi:hypothetical protein
MKSEQLKQNTEINDSMAQIHSIGICSAIHETSSIQISELTPSFNIDSMIAELPSTFSIGSMIAESFISDVSSLITELSPIVNIGSVIAESFTSDINNMIAESLSAFNIGSVIAESFTSDINSMIAESLSAFNIGSVIAGSFPTFKISTSIPESFPELEKSWDEISCEKNGNKISIKPFLKSFEYNYRHDLLRELILACSILQGIAKDVQPGEDSRNSILTTLLERIGIIVKDQTHWGRSATGVSSGELDLKIQDHTGIPIAICEAFILKSLDKNYIDIHLSKLFGYDPNGLKQNFIIIYSEASNFIELWKKYLLYVPEIGFQHPLLSIQDVSDELSEFAEIRIALAMHQRNDNTVNIYHIFMNMNI